MARPGDGEDLAGNATAAGELIHISHDARRPPTWPAADRVTHMRRIGLTGGIGSGKSTVADLFEELGAYVIDADAVAREVVAVGTDGLRALVDAFGPEILQPDGSLDRPRLADIVFADTTARATLNLAVSTERTGPQVRIDLQRGVGARDHEQPAHGLRPPRWQSARKSTPTSSRTMTSRPTFSRSWVRM